MFRFALRGVGQTAVKTITAVIYYALPAQGYVYSKKTIEVFEQRGLGKASTAKII